MQLTLLQAVGTLTPPDHPDDGTDLRNRTQDPDGDITALLVEAAQNQRRPDAEGAQGIGQAEIGQRVEHDNRGKQLPQHAALRQRQAGFAESRLLYRRAVGIQHLF